MNKFKENKMRYKLHSTLWLFLACAAMGILVFNIPMAKADNIPLDIPQLTLELPTITDAFAVPGTELNVPITVVDGYTDEDEVLTISIHIEYDSEVVRPRGTGADDIIVNYEHFPSLAGWTVIANVTDDPGTLPNAEQLRIVIANELFPILPPLSEPTIGFPADLLTIKFEVQTFREDDSTELLFLRDETGFRKRNLERLVLDDDTVDGHISFEPSPSEKIDLSLPSIVIPIGQGEMEGVMPLTVMGGYLNRDLIDTIFLTMEYDSSVVEVVNLSTDVVIDYTTFGIAPGQWIATPAVITNPDNPTLPNAHRLQIDLHNVDPSQNPALSEPTDGFPADLLTIKFTAVSSNPEDTTRVLFVDELRSFFQKRDLLRKLPVDLLYDPPGPDDDPHGDIALSSGLLESTIDIDPDTLNLTSKGNWITCYIELPEEYDVADIDVDTVLLESLLEVQHSDIQDDVLMVKFDRQDVINYIEFVLGIIPPDDVTLTVTGKLTDGTSFEGSDTIEVISKGKK